MHPVHPPGYATESTMSLHTLYKVIAIMKMHADMPRLAIFQPHLGNGSWLITTTITGLVIISETVII